MIINNEIILKNIKLHMNATIYEGNRMENKETSVPIQGKVGVSEDIRLI